MVISAAAKSAQIRLEGAMCAAQIRANLRTFAASVTRERAGFDSTGRVPDELYPR